MVNSSLPHFGQEWDDIYANNERGRRLIADHVAGFYWDDLRSPASGIDPVGQASAPDRDTETGHLLFDKNSTETIVIFKQFPHYWAEGTDIEMHLHWIKEATGVVVWQAEYKWYNIGGEWPAAYTTLTQSEVSPESGDYGDASPAFNIHVMSDFGFIAGTGKTVSSMIEVKLSRLGGNGSDNYDQDVRFLEFDIHALFTGHGSETEYSRTFGESDIAGA